MPLYLEVGTAPTVVIGPFVAPADGDTDITGLTTASSSVFLSKNGGDLTAKHDATALAHAGAGAAATSLGYYHCVLDATDTDTLGILKIIVHVATGMQVWHDYQVVTHDAYQSLCGDHVLGNAALVGQKLDHLVAVADSDDPVNNSIIAKLASKDATADWSDYDNTTDSLEARQEQTAGLITTVGAAGAGLTALGDTRVAAINTAVVTSIPATLAALATTEDIVDAMDADSANLDTIIADTTEILTRLPDAVPGAAGGLFIAGTNAAVTITSATADALTLSATGANKSGLVVAGNGSGQAVDINAGATGVGITVNGGGTSGNGIVVAATSGDAVEIAGGGSGIGMSISGGATNADGVMIYGNGSGSGINISGGYEGAGAGININAGGNGVAIASGTNGITITATDGDGIEVTGAGSGHVDIDASITDLTTLITTVGAAGVGLTNLGDARVGTTNMAVVTDIPATLAAFATTADIVDAMDDDSANLDTIIADTTEILTRLPDATAGAAGGLFIAGTNAATTITSATGSALTLSSSGSNGSGLVVTGNGSGPAVSVSGGLTGHGMVINGGGTSGNGVSITAIDGDGIEVTGAGSGHVDIDSDLSGSVGSVTGAVGSVTGMTNQTGDAYSLLGTVHTDVDAILADTTFMEKWILDKLVRTDNGDGTITYVLYDTNNSTPLATWVFTTATGTRAKAS